MTGPKEDRYRLLRATGVNTSPIVALYDDRSGESPTVLDAATKVAPSIDVVDDDGVEHRLWVVTDTGEADGAGARLRARASAGALVIADGHHRYETALRYRDERRMTRSCEEDPPFDYALMLLLEATETALTVLPTHRLIRELGDDGASLLARTGELFEVTPVASGTSWRHGSARPAPVAVAGSGCGPDGAVRCWSLGVLRSRPCWPRPERRSGRWTCHCWPRRWIVSRGSTQMRSTPASG